MARTDQLPNHHAVLVAQQLVFLAFGLTQSTQARSSTCLLLEGLQASGPGSGWGDKWPLRACAALTFPGPRQVCPGVPPLMLC